MAEVWTGMVLPIYKRTKKTVQKIFRGRHEVLLVLWEATAWDLQKSL